jgi:hypothetical protein
MKGAKMHLASVDAKEGTLSILAPAAELHLRRSWTEEGWVVRWSIKRSLESTDEGSRWLTTRQLTAAFDLSGGQPPTEEAWEITLHFKASVVEPDRFIRRYNYLCLPGPSSPKSLPECWISIELDRTIRSAVRQLIDRHPNGGSPNPDSV